MAPVLYTKERQTIEFIAQFIQRFGFAPTLKEIGNALGMNSVATVHEHLDKLRIKGYIKKLDGTVGGLEVVADKYRAGQPTTAVELPVLGYIAAGAPLEPYTDPSFYISVAPTMIAADRSRLSARRTSCRVLPSSNPIWLDSPRSRRAS